MINYVSINIPKNRLKKIGRKIVLEQIENHNILSKYQILNKYLYLTSIDPISKETKHKYRLTKAKLCSSNIDIIYDNIKDVLPAAEKIKTFAVKVERKGEHKFTSTELARELAGSVFDLFPKIQVDLKNPELIVHVKVLNNKSILYTEKR